MGIGASLTVLPDKTELVILYIPAIIHVIAPLTPWPCFRNPTHNCHPTNQQRIVLEVELISMITHRRALNAKSSVNKLSVVLLLFGGIACTSPAAEAGSAGSACTTPTSCMNPSLTCDQTQKICVPRTPGKKGPLMMKDDSMKLPSDTNLNSLPSDTKLKPLSPSALPVGQ